MLPVVGSLQPSCPPPPRRREQRLARLPSSHRPPRLVRSSDDEYEGAHKRVQEGLANILQLEVLRKQVQDLTGEEKRAFLEKARQEMDDDWHQMRAEAAERSGRDFDAAMASLTSSVDDLSRALEVQKADRRAGELEFEEWKRDMAKRRSETLFFKSLHAEKKGKPKRLLDSLDALAKPDVQESLRRLEASAKLGSSPEALTFRRNLAIVYGLTAAVLAGGLAHGLVDGSSHLPPWQLVLYGCFAAAFGASSWLSLQPPRKGVRRGRRY